jgi:hypothetical protein
MIQPRTQRILRAPEAIGGAIGLVLGFATAAGLILTGDPWYTGFRESRSWIVYWLDFPAGNLIAPGTTWRWNEGAESGFLLLSTTLNGLFWGAAGTALVRAMRRDGPFRRTVLWAGAIELPLLVLLYFTGIPSPFAGANPLAETATDAHAPGILLLRRVGLCCEHFVIDHFWLGPVQHPSPVELFLLGTSNVIMFVVFAYVGRALWRITRERVRTRSSVPVAPG